MQAYALHCIVVPYPDMLDINNACVIFCILRYIYAYSCVKYYDRSTNVVNIIMDCTFVHQGQNLLVLGPYRLVRLLCLFSL